MTERKSIPRADNLCKVRDITCVLEDNIINKTQQVFKALKIRDIKPPKGLMWSLSNLREYTSALVFLKLVIKTRKGFYLHQNGKELKKIADCKAKTLNKDEKNLFIRILFDNKRFIGFLRLFTNGLLVNNPHDLIKYGKEISLKKESIEQKAFDLFGYFDKREFSDRGVLLNWAKAIEIIEIDLEEGTYFPTLSRVIEPDRFYETLFEKYMENRDEKTLRSTIFKVRTSVCKKFKIPNSVFDRYLVKLNAESPHIVSLERAPLASFKSTDYGLIKESGEIYYYLRIRGNPNERSV